jgi:hypothetical protein
VERQDDLNRDTAAFGIAHGQLMGRRIKLFEPVFRIGIEKKVRFLPCPAEFTDRRFVI